MLYFLIRKVKYRIKKKHPQLAQRTYGFSSNSKESGSRHTHPHNEKTAKQTKNQQFFLDPSETEVTEQSTAPKIGERDR